MLISKTLLTYPNIKYYTVLLLLLIGLVSCSGNEEEFMLKEKAPPYVEPSAMRLGELRANRELVKYKAFLDSLYVENYNKSVLDKFYVWYLFADSYNRIGKDSIAGVYTDSAIYLIENNPPQNFARDNYLWAYYFKADNLLRAGNLEEAYGYYYQALSTAERYNDTCSKGYYHLKIGLIMFDAYQFDDALQYFKHAYNYCLTCDNNFGYFYRTQELLNDIALCYERLEMYDSAIYYYKEGVTRLLLKQDDYPEKWTGMKRTALGMFNGNLGGAYIGAGKLDSAELALKKSLSLRHYLLSEPVDAEFTRIKLALLYVKRGKLTLARQTLDEVYASGYVSSVQPIRSRWYRVSSLYYGRRGNFDDAYKYLKAHKACEDSIRKTRTSFSLASIDNKVKSIGTSYRIASLEQTAATRKIYLVTFIVLALLALVIIIQVISSLRRSKKYVAELQSMNEQINEQQQKLKAALAELENADEEKDRILKAVSHDMRSPVNSVLALTSLLDGESEKMTDDQKEYLALIKKSGENALHLTEDLLEVATLKTEKLETQPVDITAEIDARVKLLQFKASEKEQKIIFTAPENHISANVNQEKLLRVIGNLVNNAIKFSPVGEEIKVELSASNEVFQVEVQDRGIGIPDAMKTKVFDLFSEAKRYGTSGEQPYGLGLSISKQIVEAHNGRIWFESKEGQGTKFFIEIPV